MISFISLIFRSILFSSFSFEIVQSALLLFTDQAKYRWIKKVNTEINKINRKIRITTDLICSFKRLKLNATDQEKAMHANKQY